MEFKAKRVNLNTEWYMIKNFFNVGKFPSRKMCAII